MSTEIKINKKTALNKSSGVLEELYNEVNNIILQKQMVLNIELSEFMDVMNDFININGYLHIDDFITTSGNVQILLELLEPAINKLKKELPDFTINALWGFYKELMIYGDELRTQGK